jgi:hypothetical protein
MKTVIEGMRRLHEDEQGHVEVGVPSLLAAVGAIMLAIGAAGGTDWLTYVGGIILGLGIFVTGLARHRLIDYDVWERLDRVEKAGAVTTPTARE